MSEILAREGHHVDPEVVAEWAARYRWAERMGAVQAECPVPMDVASRVAQIAASAEAPPDLRDLRSLGAAIEQLTLLSLAMVQKAGEAVGKTGPLTAGDVAALATTSAVVLRVATMLRLAVFEHAPQLLAPANGDTSRQDQPAAAAGEPVPTLSEVIATFEAQMRHTR